MHERWSGYYTTDTVARLLKLNKETIAKWCREGKIKAIKLPLRWLIKKEDFDAFVKDNSHGISRGSSDGRSLGS